MTLAELGLTPTQQAEVAGCEPTLVAAWLRATVAAKGLERPAGFFLSGVRSGNMPTALGEDEQRQRVELAERWLVNAGWGLPTEAELLDALFGPHGELRAWADDEQLRARLLVAWRLERPRAAALEQERAERAQRWRHGQRLLRSGVEPIPWPVRQHAYADSGSARQGI